MDTTAHALQILLFSLFSNLWVDYLCWTFADMCVWLTYCAILLKRTLLSLITYFIREASDTVCFSSRKKLISFFIFWKTVSAWIWNANWTQQEVVMMQSWAEIGASADYIFHLSDKKKQRRVQLVAESAVCSGCLFWLSLRSETIDSISQIVNKTWHMKRFFRNDLRKKNLISATVLHNWL